MLRLRHLATEVAQIYLDSQSTFSDYQKQTGLTCRESCGACCLSPEISATPLEMLPTAFYLLDRNMAIEVLTILEKLEYPRCFFYKAFNEDGTKGTCQNYQNRPSICRSFGAAAVKNKYGEKSMSICKLIKQDHSEIIKDINPSDAPVIGEFARKIMGLDPDLGQKVYPINKALEVALAMILQLKHYGDLSSI